MTTENESDVIQTVETIENKEDNQIPATNADEIIVSKVEDEQVNVEKPKRGGRKKREVTAIIDVKAENFNNDNAVDTQPLFEQPVILEGKRSRKPTARLELSDLVTPKKELSIPQGHGKALGEIEYIDYQITHASTDALSRMRNICFGRRASKTDIRQNLRDFNGFEFERDSDEYKRHLSNLVKLKKDQLESISDILGLAATGLHEENAEQILTFLMAPVDEGKAIPERKLSMRTAKKPNINSKESVHTDDEENEIENGEDEDELFTVEDEEEEEGDGTDDDDDYIGSDDEGGIHTKDDPDDFVYQPGKKTPKKRPSMKRSRSRTTPKRKRGTSKRGRKKSKVIVNKKVENEDLTTVPSEPTAINDEQIETKNDDLNTIDTETTTTMTTDIIPATS